MDDGCGMKINGVLLNERRQSTTTEEILIARGFRRQSTTEEMMRCRNFRRQSTQSEELSKTRGRRDSCAQISDGTVATMTVETTAAFYDTSTQTGPHLLLHLSNFAPLLRLLPSSLAAPSQFSTASVRQFKLFNLAIDFSSCKKNK